MAKVTIFEVTHRPCYELVSMAGPDRPIYVGQKRRAAHRTALARTKRYALAERLALLDRYPLLFRLAPKTRYSLDVRLAP